jgi:formylglycine-generating enzyme required for sulfatase activity
LWEFLHLATDEQALGASTPVGDTRDEASGLVFVLVPGGTFEMGSWPISVDHPAGSPHADAGHRIHHEEPVHPVTLYPFFLSKFEMTQAQWLRVTGTNPSSSGGQGPILVPGFGRQPVENVSWDECVQWLERMDLVLPTEAQWEYACRAGTTTVFSCGDDVASLQGYANLSDRSREGNVSPPGLPFEADLLDSLGGHGIVGSFAANAWGFHDMHGNVWEWCRDGILDAWQNYDSAVEDPVDGMRAGPLGPLRASRGGSFMTLALSARSAARSDNLPDAHQEDQGLRPARALVR